MPAFRRRLMGKVPLHWVLAIPFVLLTTGAVSLVGYLSHRSGQRAVEEMAYQLLNQASERVRDRLHLYLQAHQQTIAAQRLAVERGELNLQDRQAVNNRLWQAISFSPLLNNHTFQSAAGSQLGYVRLQSQELANLATAASGVQLSKDMVLAQRIDDVTTKKQVFYRIDERGTPTQPVYSIMNDLRQREWFQLAQQNPQQAWSPIFAYRPVPTIGIMAIAPVFDRNRNFQGVFSASLALSEISTFLQTLDFSPSGQIFIIERSCDLVATSTADPAFVKSPQGQPQRLPASRSSNPVTRAIAQQLNQQLTDLKTLETPTSLTLRENRQKQFVQVVPFRDAYGLDWLIVTVVPESDFIGEIRRNVWQTFLLSGLTLLGTTATGILMAFWIAKPIQRLSQVSRSLAEGNWQNAVQEDSQITELSVLAQSFNQTAAHLQQSFEGIRLALQNSEEKFTTVFRASPDPIIITQFLAGVCLEANQQAIEFCGYSHAELIGKNLAELGLWHNLAERDRWFDCLHRDRKVYNFEANIATQSGEVKTALLSAEVHTLNEQSCVILVLRDISDRKRLERALQTSEAKIKDVLNSAGAAIASAQFFKDGHWQIDQVSAGAERMSGYTALELTQDSFLWINCIHPNDWQAIEAQVFADISAAGTATYEYRFYCKNGTQRWIAQTNTSRWNEMQQCWDVTIISVDITERKQAESRLLQLERWLQQHSRLSPSSVYTLVQEPDGKLWFEYVGSAVETLHEVTVEQALQDASLLLNSMHPDDRGGYQAAVIESIQNLSPFSYQWRILTPSGKLKWLQANSQPERREHGAIAWYGVVVDITDSKQAEEKLRQSEANLRKAQAIARLGNWEYDALTQQASWSDEIYSIHGFDPEYCKPLENTIQYIHPEDRLKYQVEILNKVENQQEFTTDLRILRKDGSTRFIEAKGEPIFDDHQRLTGFRGTIQDITERKLVEAALRNSEARFQQLGTASPGILYSVVEQLHGPTRFEYISTAAAEIHELSLAEIQHDPGLVFQQIHPDDRIAYQKVVSQSLATMQLFQHEWRIITPSGKVKWIQANSRPARQKNGDIVWHGIVLDVSDRKQVELALQRNEEQLRLLADALPVFISYADTAQCYQFVNKTYELYFGLSREQIKGQHTRDIIGEVNYALSRSYIERALAGESVSYELTLSEENNLDRCLSAMLVPDFDNAHQVRGYYSLAIDISDRKAAEMSLRRYERIVSNTPDAIALIDANYRYQIVNRTYLNWHNINDCEVIGSTLSDCLGQEYFESVIKPHFDLCLSGETIQYSRWLDLAGVDRLFLSITYVPYFDANQTVSGVVVSLRDITTIKQTEDALRQSEERFREIASTISQLFFVRSATTGEFLYISPAYTKIWGQPCEDLYQNPDAWLEYIHPDDRDLVSQSLREQFNGQPVRREYRIIRADGLTRWISSEVLVVRDGLGHPLRFVGMAEDITERRQAEQRVQAEVDFRRTIEAAIVEGIAVADMNGRQIYVNPGFCEMLGWTEAELLGQVPPYVYWPPEEVEAIQQAFADCLAGRRPPEGLELRFMRRNGERFDVLILDAPLQDSHGQTIAWLASVYDITERKQEQRSRQQALQQIDTHFQDSPLAIIQWNRDFQILRWSKQAERLFGWTAEEVKDVSWREFQFIHEDDRDLINTRLMPLINGAISSQTIINRNYTKQGKVLLCQWYSSAVFDETGQLVSVLSFAEDISERAQMEAALRQSEQKFRGAFDTISAGMALVSPAGGFLEVNAALCQMLGYSELELLQRKLQDLDHPDDDELNVLWAERIFSGQQSAYQVEKRFLTQSGVTVWGLMNLALMPNMQGKPLYLIVQITNISDRKRAEEALSTSEARNRAILSAIPDLIFLYTTDGIYLDAMQTNSVYNLITDANPIGKHLSDLIPSEVAERQIKAIQKLVESGEPIVYEQEVWVQGKWQYEEVRMVPCGDNTILEIVRDISDRKLREIERQVAEEALRESEERFRRAFEDAAIGMAWVGVDGRFLKVSQSLCEIVGYQEEELLACRFHDITHPEDLPTDLELSERVLAGEQRVYQREKRYIHKNGYLIWVLVNVSLVKDREGQPLYFVSQVQDISDRHELDRIKDEFISIVSHELRTPLTAIRGSLGILETGILDDEPETAKQMLQVALNNSDRLVRLVNDILDLERLESGGFQLLIEECYIDDLLQQALESVQAIALQAAITLQISSLKARVRVAPDAIVQAIVNLLGNAIKFSPTGSTVWLTVDVWQPDPDYLCFAIRDQGRGIPPEKLETIFGRFQQVDVSDSRQKGGTGLGLAICKSIVQQHQGTIWAESVLGAGSTFYFTIPFQHSHD